MSNFSFFDSFEKRPGQLTFIAKEKMKSEGFLSSTRKRKKFQREVEKIKPDIDFLNADVKKSMQLPEHLFTNFLSHKTDQDIKTGVFEVINNPSVADSKKVDKVRMNKKIIECIRLYYEDLDEDSILFKSNLFDAIGSSKPVRIFTIPEFDPSIPKATYKIVLIDPFHLVIPSEYRDKSKLEMESDTYRKNSDNQLCMFEYVKTIYEG